MTAGLIFRGINHSWEGMTVDITLDQRQKVLEFGASNFNFKFINIYKNVLFTLNILKHLPTMKYVQKFIY